MRLADETLLRGAPRRDPAGLAAGEPLPRPDIVAEIIAVPPGGDALSLDRRLCSPCSSSGREAAKRMLASRGSGLGSGAVAARQAHSPARITGVAVPSAARLSISTAPEPIIQSMRMSERLQPRATSSFSLIERPPRMHFE